MSKKQKSKTTSAASHLHYGCVEFIHPSANEVCIAGSFNDWHPKATPMILRGNGKWVKKLALSPGRYEYRFVVDGRWVDDPAAKETVLNPFGGFNVVLVVDDTASKQASSLANAKPQPSRRAA